MTLGQFQEIWKINKSDIDQDDKMTEMVSVLSGITFSQAEEMNVIEFNKLAIEIKKVLNQPFKVEKPQKYLGGYAICYEPAKLDRGQFISVQHFMKGDIYDNAHFILASLSYNEKTGKHESLKHKQIAESIQEEELEKVIPSCLFFCDLYKASIQSLQNFLAKELIAKGVNPRTTHQLMTDLLSVLDGYTMLSRSQTLKESA